MSRAVKFKLLNAKVGLGLSTKLSRPKSLVRITISNLRRVSVRKYLSSGRFAQFRKSCKNQNLNSKVFPVALFKGWVTVLSLPRFRLADTCLYWSYHAYIRIDGTSPEEIPYNCGRNVEITNNYSLWHCSNLGGVLRLLVSHWSLRVIGTVNLSKSLKNSVRKMFA